jgi:hypothetical protein
LNTISVIPAKAGMTAEKETFAGFPSKGADFYAFFISPPAIFIPSLSTST